MDPRDKVRNTKSSDCLIKIRNDKEKIKDLMIKIKNKNLFESDFSNSVIDCFIQENFRPLFINDIISVLMMFKVCL